MGFTCFLPTQPRLIRMVSLEEEGLINVDNDLRDLLSYSLSANLNGVMTRYPMWSLLSDIRLDLVLVSPLVMKERGPM